MAMASAEHQILSTYLKDVHLTLRKTASKLGAEKAWQEHCKNNETLRKYAKFMKKLATEHWIHNDSQSRITWTADFCHKYFIEKEYVVYDEKEVIIADKINIKLDYASNWSNNIKLLDVGSCYNPFEEFKTFLDVTAIDLCPANESVLQCDILGVPVGPETIVNERKMKQLQEESFEVVVFCFLLEYIPSSDLRISACSKAYSLLKPGGLLIICTPDSKHVGANAKLMKSWRYTLSQLGFNRIHYSKYKYIHCMAFRKSLHKLIAARWAQIHKEPYMKFALNIPQDFNEINYNDATDTDILHNSEESIRINIVDLSEMPFNDSDIL